MAWTTIVLDGFSGDPDYTNLTSHTIAPTNSISAAWAADEGTMLLATGAATVGTAGQSRYYLSGSVAADQAVAVTIVGTDIDHALYLRYASGNTGYRFLITSTTWEVRPMSAGSPGSAILSGTSTFTNGDVIRLEMVSDAIVALKNGTTLGSTTDSTFTSGTVALYYGHTVVDGWGDDFTVQTWSTGGGSDPLSDGKIIFQAR